jgi:hypothetical protein
MTHRKGPAANPVEPIQDIEHDDKAPHEHPKSKRVTPKPVADTAEEKRRRSEGEGTIESVDGSDEDSRSRRRDLGP